MAIILIIFQGTIVTNGFASTRGVNVITDLSHKSGKIGRYKAYIIAIADYVDPRIPDLETPLADAKALAELLRSHYGFVIETLLDQKATRSAIYDGLRRLSNQAEPNDSILIYYAGHGDLDRQFDDGWWIPADAKAGEPSTYLDNVQIQKALRGMAARHVLLISDSCYSGTLFGRSRAIPPVVSDTYYLELYNEKSRWGLTSGNKTPVADSGSGGHSVFAYQLIKELRRNQKPFLSIQELYTKIAPIISNNSEQTPMCRPIRNTGDQGGEFVFISARGEVVEEPKKGRIFVHSQPDDTTIRIMNIRPAFQQGIQLPPGRYQLEASAKGHEKKLFWTTLTPGEEKYLEVFLTPVSISRLVPRNTSRPDGKGRWDWTVYIDTDSSTRQRIRCVEYTLHKTFPDPIRTRCNPEDNFALQTNGWGTFRIQIRVMFKDGTEKRLHHDLVFR